MDLGRKRRGRKKKQRGRRRRKQGGRRLAEEERKAGNKREREGKEEKEGEKVWGGVMLTVRAQAGEFLLTSEYGGKNGDTGICVGLGQGSAPERSASSHKLEMP